MNSLREKIRDQKYPNGFITTDFPEICDAGIMHKRLLEKTLISYDGKPNSQQWAHIPGTDCVIRSIK